mgnify:FL=1
MHLSPTIFVADLNIFGYTMREFMVDGGTCLVAVTVGVVANVIGYKIMRRAVNDVSIPKLADGLVAGLVGLLCFLLGLTLNDARENYIRAIQSATEEALQCRLMYQDFSVLAKLNNGEQSAKAQSLAVEYVQNVIDHEWPQLGESTPRLNEKAGILLTQMRLALNPTGGTFLSTRTWTGLGTVEHLRESRLRFAMEQSPNGFWIIIAILLALSCALMGSVAPTKMRLVLIATFCLGIGVVCVLIDEYEKPYGGWIAIDAQSIFLPSEMSAAIPPA